QVGQHTVRQDNGDPGAGHDQPDLGEADVLQVGDELGRFLLAFLDAGHGQRSPTGKPPASNARRAAVYADGFTASRSPWRSINPLRSKAGSTSPAVASGSTLSSSAVSSAPWISKACSTNRTLSSCWCGTWGSGTPVIQKVRSLAGTSFL